MNKFLVLSVAFALALVNAGHAVVTESANPDLSITSLDRTLDMTSQLVKTNLRMTFQNGGKSPAKSVHITVDPDFVDHVTHIAVTVRSSFSFIVKIV